MNTIIGLPRWNAPDAYYSQTNNVVEAVIRKAKGTATGWLETCGPTAAVMLLDAVDKLETTRTPGGWEPQPEDILAAWMNDARNADAMALFRDDLDPNAVFGNQVPQWYEPAVDAVFGVRAKFEPGVSLVAIGRALEAGRGVLVTLKNPGHYIAIVAFDPQANQLIYHDPWPNNPWPAALQGKPGAGRRVNSTILLENLKPYRVEIG
jgi:hypothetical protein